MFNAKSLQLHPFLFAIYPILVLYFSNAEILPLGLVLKTLLATLIVTAALWGSSSFLLKDKEKAALIVTLLWAWLYLFRVLNEAAVPLFKEILHIHLRGRFTLVIWTAFIFMLMLFIARRKGSLSNITSVLNVISTALVAFALSMSVPGSPFRVSMPHASKTQEAPEHAEEPLVEVAQNQAGEGDFLNAPDVYYIILDSYTRYDTLKRDFDFDNQEFYDYLREENFYIAEKSLSNYQKTGLSLSSSLNMDFLDHVTADPRKGLPDDLRSKGSAVKTVMRSKGYEVIDMPAFEGDAADAEFREYLFFKYMRDKTVLYGLQWLVPFNQDARRAKVEAKFAALVAASKRPEKKFVFAHIMPPHPPFFIYGPNGEGFSWDKIAVLPQLGLVYAYHIQYVNRLLEKTIDAILANAKTPPIIILQGDHGSVVNNASLTRSTRSTEFLVQRMSILNAYYLPDGGERFLYDSITPVNTFRLIFNHYFDGDYELLKDDSWFIYYDETGKKMINVTDQLVEGDAT